MAAAAATPTTALVPTAGAAGALVVQDAKNLAAAWRSNATAALKDTNITDEEIKIGGISFPMRVKKVTKIDPKDREASYAITGIVGNLKNCRGKGVILGDGFALVPLNRGKNAKDKDVPLPKSIDGSRMLTHKLVAAGQSITVFCPATATSEPARSSIVYVVAAKPNFTVRVPKVAGQQQKDGSPGANSNGGGSVDRSSNPSATAAAYQRRGRQPSMAGKALGMTPFPGTAAASADAAETEGGIDDEYGNDVFANDEKTLKALLDIVPPATRWSGRNFLEPELAAAYLSPESLMTKPERVRLEFEHPEVAAMVPDFLKGDVVGWTPSVTLNCKEIVSVQKQDYVGQNSVDNLKLLELRPDMFETIITREIITARDRPVIRFVARMADDLDAVSTARIGDPHCDVPVLCHVTYVTELQQTKGQQDREPFACWSPEDRRLNMRFMFNAMVESWDRGTSFMEAKHMHVTMLGSAYRTLIVPSFGISELEPWKRLAGLILPNTKIVYSASVDQEKTARLKYNVTKKGDDSNAEIALYVEDMIPDFGEALRKRIGIPITVARAASLLRKSVPSEAEIKASKPINLGSVICLTENPHMFPEAVAAGCDFYALTTSSIHKTHEVCLAHLGPEIGSALFAPEWYDRSKSFVVEDASKVIIPGGSPDELPHPLGKGKAEIGPKDELRLLTLGAKDLLNERTIIYLYAVRSALSSTNADRAQRALNVFYSGGDYDQFGFPIVGAGPAPAKPLLIAAAPAAQQIQSQAPPPPAADVVMKDATAPPPANDNPFSFIGVDDSALLSMNIPDSSEPKSQQPPVSRAKMPVAAVSSETAHVTRKRSTRSRSPARNPDAGAAQQPPRKAPRKSGGGDA